MKPSLKNRESCDFYEVYEYDGIKKIRILGYVYCAGDSVTKDASQIYRKVEYSSGLRYCLPFFTNMVKEGNILQEFDECKQYIADINEKEAEYYLDSFNELGECENLPFAKITDDTPIGYYCNCESDR